MSTQADIDAVRRALADCVFPPATNAKRFVRNVNVIPIEKVTEAQRDYLTQLAWKFRRQMPRDLVPTQMELLAIADKQRARQRAVEAERLRRRRRAPPLVLHQNSGFPILDIMMIG